MGAMYPVSRQCNEGGNYLAIPDLAMNIPVADFMLPFSLYMANLRPCMEKEAYKMEGACIPELLLGGEACKRAAVQEHSHWTLYE